MNIRRGYVHKHDANEWEYHDNSKESLAMRTKLRVQMIVLSILALLTGCTPVTPEITATPSRTVTMISSPKTSDIKVEFDGYQERNNAALPSFAFYICFDLPAEEKWILDDIILRTADKEILPMFQAWGMNSDGRNCHGIMFSREEIPDSGEAELSIGKVRTYFSREKRNCDKAQKELDQANSGITIKCDLDWSGTVSDFEILEKPQNMSEEHAREKVHAEFLNEIQVDWKFMFLIEKP
jgi:hypothetical protein